MRDTAIYQLYPEVKQIAFGVCYDAQKNIITVDEQLITNKITELQAAEPLRQLRVQRTQLLAQTDWRMTTDYPYSDQAEWASYRTALRDLPSTASPTLDEQGNLIVDWPTPPDAV